MSAPEGFRPPERITTRAITAQARYVERLRIRRTKLRKALVELDISLRNAEKVLRSIVQDATTPAPELPPIDHDQAEQLIDRAHGELSP